MSTPTPSPFRLDGLIAVVTGGATGISPSPSPSHHLPLPLPNSLPTLTTPGIGAMISNSLITAGASKVYILSRRPFTPPHPSQQHIQCDITSKDSLLSAVSQIEKESGHINLLVANSGIVGPILRFDPNLPITQIRKNLFSDISMEAFTNVLHVNTTSTFFTVTAFLELLDRGNQNAIRGGEGAYGAPLEAGKEAGVPSVQSQVIVTSSVAGMMRIQQSFPAYAASKAASLHLVKVMSSAFVGYGIRVNALVPGCKFLNFFGGISFLERGGERGVELCVGFGRGTD